MFRSLRYVRNKYVSMTKTTRMMIAVITCMCLVLLFCIISVITAGPQSYNFMHNKSEINKIYICPAYSLNDDLTCNKEVSIEIKDIDTFVVELENLNFYEHLLGDPPGTHEFAVLIEYVNGDRQYFDNWVHWCIRDGKQIKTEVLSCEIDEYDAFIQKCMEIAES